MGTERVAIVGGGVVGSALGRALGEAGHPVVMVASRTVDSAGRAAAFIGGAGPSPAVTTDLARTLTMADLVLVAVPDRALDDVAAALAAAPTVPTSVCVAHTAGAWPAAVLAPVAARGARIGALHPLQSFVSAEDAVDRLPGTVFGVEGEDVAFERLAALVATLRGRVLRVPADARPLYHAAAVLVSNYTAVLAGAAATLMEAHVGTGPDTALAALLPLLESTVANLQRVGLPRALTGPVARGDVDTVRAHVAALRTRAPDLLPLYVAAGRLAVAMGEAKGTLAPEPAAALRALFAPSNSD